MSRMEQEEISRNIARMRVEMRSWTLEEVRGAWADKARAPEFTRVAAAHELDRRSNMGHWRSWGLRNGVPADRLDAWTDFVESWSGEDLRDALRAFRGESA